MKISTTTRMLVMAACLLFTATAWAEDDKDTTVVIPETGHLAFKGSRNFTGPSTVTVSNYYGSSNAKSKGLVFNNQVLGEDVVIACQASSSSALILTANPGTYTLTFTDRTATKQFFSTSVYWTESPATAYKEGYSLYKFVNTAEKVGFQRDENYASENYQHCDLAEGENIYFPASSKVLERITATMGTTVAELSFIPWDEELWGCPMPGNSSAITTLGIDSKASGTLHNLAGQRVKSSYKGIVIRDGRKTLVK